jgi:hypothetical protein
VNSGPGTRHRQNRNPCLSLIRADQRRNRRSPSEGISMSSLARRSLRTTAAAAGIAAIGVSFAGPVLAAELPALPGADALGAPDLAALPEMLGGLPAAPAAGLAQLPDLFSFQMPSTTPGSEGVADSGQSTNEVEGPAAAGSESESESEAAPESESEAAPEAEGGPGGLPGLGGLPLPLAGPDAPAVPGAANDLAGMLEGGVLNGGTFGTPSQSGSNILENNSVNGMQADDVAAAIAGLMGGLG